MRAGPPRDDYAFIETVFNLALPAPPASGTEGCDGSVVLSVRTPNITYDTT